jgi:hypothetical protein
VAAAIGIGEKERDKEKDKGNSSEPIDTESPSADFIPTQTAATELPTLDHNEVTTVEQAERSPRPQISAPIPIQTPAFQPEITSPNPTQPTTDMANTSDTQSKDQHKVSNWLKSKFSRRGSRSAKGDDNQGTISKLTRGTDTKQPDQPKTSTKTEEPHAHSSNSHSHTETRIVGEGTSGFPIAINTVVPDSLPSRTATDTNLSERDVAFAGRIENPDTSTDEQEQNEPRVADPVLFTPSLPVTPLPEDYPRHRSRSRSTSISSLTESTTSQSHQHHTNPLQIDLSKTRSHENRQSEDDQEEDMFEEARDRFDDGSVLPRFVALEAKGNTLSGTSGSGSGTGVLSGAGISSKALPHSPVRETRFHEEL